MSHSRSSRRSETGQTRLLELGYAQGLPRLLPWPYNTAIAFCILSSVSNLTVCFTPALVGGGPATLLWSWVVSCVFTVLTALSLSEICSALPNSGGLYFYACMLSGRQGPLAGWITGYMNVFGQVALLAGQVYSLMQLLSVTVALGTTMMYGQPYEFTPAEVIVISGVVMAFQGLLNSMSGLVMGWAAMVFTTWMIGGGFFISWCLVLVSKRNHSVWWLLAEFQEPSIYQSDYNHGYNAFLSGIIMSTWSLMGYDAAAHMIEETISADRAARCSFLLTAGISSVCGFLYLLGLAICIQDWQSLFDPGNETSGMMPAVQVLWDGFTWRFGSGIGAVMLMTILIVAAFGAGMSTITAGARMINAFARDDGLPKWLPASYINSRGVPLGAVWFLVICAFLPFLTLLWSPILLTNVFAAATLGLTISYGIPVFCRLVLARHTFVPGPFSLGRWTHLCGWTVIAWTVAAALICSLPLAFPITVTDFNYSAGVLGIVLLGSFASWHFSARHWFQGPQPSISSSDAVRVKEFGWK
ncbi:hypothetical protein WJX74_003154 [Apatococcus lobatus]|uniref:Amino acid transporter n=1 Tax=Apatococcus lobatus TaxID=904363 RepID=A0AAW1QYE3_9CHLO